jgi:hypothetical protein
MDSRKIRQALSERYSREHYLAPPAIALTSSSGEADTPSIG